MLQKELLEVLSLTTDRLSDSFKKLPRIPSIDQTEKIANVLNQVAVRLEDNFPYFHPYYAGQMLKPPHAIAQLAYALAMNINPNNHALDGGRASSGMEKEAVAHIAAMYGWPVHLGHLTSGGTMANLEALYIAGQIHPDGFILASETSHYTHERISGVLKLPFKKVRTSIHGTMDLNHLEDICKLQKIGTVVATMGTTGAGMVDPLPEILQLKDKYGFRVHADAAYGGYFILSAHLAENTRRKFEHLKYVDSLVIDPHKHGLQPYGCGCIIFQDVSVATHYLHDSPYTYFSSSEIHLGEISLECSRAGAAAVALWATQKLLPNVPGGEFADNLDKGVEAARRFKTFLDHSNRFKSVYTPELDIVIYSPIGADTKEISEKSQWVFDRAAEKDLHLALLKMKSEEYAIKTPGVINNSDYTTCLRSVFMKPEHCDWVEKIFSKLMEISW